MNAKILFAALFGLATIASPVSVADTVAGTPDATVHYAATRVGSAVAVLPLLNGTSPSTTARYYIYLCSAGWCQPCNREMPHVVEAYKKMKESGLVELILVDCDRNAKDAQEFIARHGINFPAAMHDKCGNLPGFKMPRSVPSAQIVDAEGHLVKLVHGSTVPQWKQVISEYEKKHGLEPSFPGEVTLTHKPDYSYAEVEEEEAVEDSADKAVANAMANIQWFNGKPNLKADYYIYLQSASWCGPCRAEMPHIVKAYKAMKRSRRVEMVLLSGDKNLKGAKSYLKEFKAKFPAVMNNAPGVVKLPGANAIPAYFPAAAIVKADGTVVKAGHGEIILDWRKYTIDAED